MGMHCPITGVNIPRFLIMSVIGFLFLFGYDYLVHHVLLMDTYEQTTDLWRNPETMQDFFPLMLARQLIVTMIIGYIFTRNFEGRGICEGLRFGLPIGLLLGTEAASAYIWLPISQELALSWFASSVGMGLGLGVIFSLIYKK